MITADQPFVPVLLGGDIGVYSLAREFHEAYGVVSQVVSATDNWLISDSVAIEAHIMGPMFDDATVIPELIQIAGNLTKDGERPLLLISGFDHLVKMIVTHREELSEWYTIPYPDLDQIERATDKVSFQQLCRDLDIPHPRTLTFDMGAAASRQNPLEARVAGLGTSLNRAGLGWPIIVKPADSAQWATTIFDGWQKVYRIHGLDDLLKLLRNIKEAGYKGSMLIQELIGGGDENMRLMTCFVDENSKIRLTGYAQVALEAHAPGMEGNSLVILTDTNQTVERQATQILQELNWRGFAMFDLKVDPKDGQAKFFELNPRLGRNHMYLTAAGHNPAHYYVRHFLPAIDGTELPATTQAAKRAGYTVLPLSVTYKQGSTEQQAKLKELGKDLLNPYYYAAETNRKRKLTIASRQAKAALQALRGR